MWIGSMFDMDPPPCRKRKLGSRKQAARVRRRQEDKGRIGMRPYQCPRCNAWHIGHGEDVLGESDIVTQ